MADIDLTITLRLTELKTLVTSIARHIPWLDQMDHHMQEVTSGALTALIMRGLGALLGFGSNVFVARLLGAEGAGVYYLALTVTTIATLIGRFGLDNAALRFTATNAAQGNWSTVAALYRKSMLFALGLSAIVSLCIISLAPWSARNLFSKSALVAPLRLMALSIAPLSLLMLHGEFLRGLKRIGSAVLLQGLGIPLLNLPLLVVLAHGLGIDGAAIAYSIAAIIVLLLGIVLWHRATPQSERSAGSGFSTYLLIATSLPLFGVALMNLVLSSADTVLLGIFSTSHAVGIYGAANRTAALTSFILVAVNSIAAPKFATLHAQGDLDALGELTRNTAKLVTLVASPLLLLFVTIPSWLLRLFGPEFAQGGPALAILAVGQFINVATGSVGYLLMMTGHERLMRNNAVFSALLCVVIGVILIPRYEAVGAAIATSTSLAAMNIISAFLVYFKLNIIPIPFLKRALPDVH